MRQILYNISCNNNTIGWLRGLNFKYASTWKFLRFDSRFLIDKLMLMESSVRISYFRILKILSNFEEIIWQKSIYFGDI